MPSNTEKTQIVEAESPRLERAYKAVWVDAQNQPSSLMAGSPGFYRPGDKSGGQAIPYPVKGEWTTSPSESCPLLFAFDTLSNALEFAVHEFCGTVAADRILPSSSPFQFPSVTIPRPPGHIEVWMCDCEEHRFDNAPTVSLAPPGTLLCRKLRLVEKVHDLARNWQGPTQTFMPDYLPEPEPREQLFEFQLANKGSAQAVIKVTATSYAEAWEQAEDLQAMMGVPENDDFDTALRRLDSASVPHPLDGIKCLTKGLARRLNAYPDPIDRDVSIGWVQTMTAAAAEELKYKPFEYAYGISSLSPEVARILAAPDSPLRFISLREISDQVAEALADHEGILQFDLTGSWDEQNQRPGAKTEIKISNYGAIVLATHKGPLDFPRPRGLCEAAIRALDEKARRMADDMDRLSNKGNRQASL